MAEVGGGVAVPASEDLGSGMGLHAALGVGGKWRGFPPRFYVLFGTRWASFAGEVVQTPTGRGASADVSDTELFGGLRMVVPAGWILRVVFEGDLGTNFHQELVVREEGPLVHEQWAPLWAIAGGLQARYHRRASAGLRLSHSWRGLDPTRATRAAGWTLDDEGTRTAIELTHTWHF